MKKLLSLFIAAIMCFSTMSTVFAAEFNFTDVKTSDWFYNDVKSAVEMGLINGKSPTTYAPNDNLTYAEAFKLAACMNQLYTEGVITLTSGNPWYKSYVDYCSENDIGDDILVMVENRLTQPATREAYMAIFAESLPDEALKEINNIPDDSIPDFPSERSLARYIYKLYRAGILTGVDEAHNCNPEANIKRSEVAAILTRMMDESKRVEFNMGNEEQKPEEKEPEEKEPEVTEPEVKEPETTGTSSGGAKDKFQQAETVEDTEDKGFLMYAEDVFYVTGKGVVATGRIIKGELKKGDAIKIISADGSETEATVAGIEMFNKNLDEAKKGDNIGLLLSSEIEKGAVARGDALIGADAGYDVANMLVGTLTLLTKEEGGRTTAIEEEFSPQFYYANDVTGVITGLTDGTMNPGETQENITVKFTSHKGVWYVGQTLEVRQAGRKLGTFIVTKIGSSSSRPSTGTRPSTGVTRPGTTTEAKVFYAEVTAMVSPNDSGKIAYVVDAFNGSGDYSYRWERSSDGSNWDSSSYKTNTHEFDARTKSYTRCKITDNVTGEVVYSPAIAPNMVAKYGPFENVKNDSIKAAYVHPTKMDTFGGKEAMYTSKDYELNAVVIGGTAPYTYQWSYAEKNSDNFEVFGTNQSSIKLVPSEELAKIKCVVTDANGKTVTSEIFNVTVVIDLSGN